MSNSGLKNQLIEIIAESGADMALSALHIESGDRFDIEADRSFPLCSVFKIPVLVEAFRRIESGQLSLDERFELTVAEKNLPSGVLLFFDDGLYPTLRDLLTLMIIISDNTATDMVMHRIGVDATTRTMHQLGFDAIHVPLTVRDIFEDLFESADPTLDLHQHAVQPQKEGRIAYSTGPENNVGTPRALTDLCAQIYQGQIISRAACNGMLEILLKQQLNSRLPLFLPPGTRFAHKTGTLSGFRNDSGILYASDSDHIAVTVFCKWDANAVADDPVAQWERINQIDSAFGRIGRALYENYR